MAISEELLRIEGVSFNAGMTPVLKDITLNLRQGDYLSVTGNSGSGKSILGRILAGLEEPSSGERLARPGLRSVMVHQQDQFMLLSGRRSTYYGQRYEQQGMENTPEVGAYLAGIAAKIQPTADATFPERIMQEMQISHLSQTKLLHLSNGERKRTQLAAALLQRPGLLILDQPFAGLDTTSRLKLTEILDQQIKNGLSVVLICDAFHIPQTVGRVLELKNGRISRYVAREDYAAPEEEPGTVETDGSLFQVLPPHADSFPELIGMKNVQVSIGEKRILNQVNWTVKGGERWVLLGPNGAGKTTLLSLITADHPQGYTNELSLFGRRRGSGESIWDIKRKIGYVSPELHLYFLRGAGIINTIPGLYSRSAAKYDSMSCLDVLLSGFRDETGFASAPTDLQREIALTWLRILQLNELQHRLYTQASFGQQRLLLLGRALVKSPPLLILDEPCQGLDHSQRTRFIRLLDTICCRLPTALIYVTHMQEEIPSCTDKMIRLEEGRVTFCGNYP